MTNQKQELKELFQTTFATEPEFYMRSPGRINLIGEHTDYNMGHVMPMAIDKEIVLAARKNNSQVLRVYAREIDQRMELNIDDFKKDEGHSEYFKGCLNEWKKNGHKVIGLDLIVISNLPVGAGLSSSAALETLILRTLEYATYGKLEIPATEIALWAQSAECNWVGVKCGIMDQLACAASKQDSAILVDCETLETQKVTVPKNLSFLVLDTGTRRDLHSSEFNLRQEQCFSAAKKLGVRNLKKVDKIFNKSNLSPEEIKRVNHVVSENKRVFQAKEALAKNDFKQFGEILDAGHRSLAEDFEVSTLALDKMCEIARSKTGTFGARMVGAGFGGCAIAAVKKDLAQKISAEVEKEYNSLELGLGKVYICNSAAGTSLL